MSELLTINCLPFERPTLLLKTLNNWLNIDQHVRDKLIINIHTDDHDKTFDGIYSEFKNIHIKCTIIRHPDHNYMPKIHKSVMAETEFSMKMDEDIFLSHYVLEYMIENLSILHDSNNLILTPTLSTGIPTLEDFIDDVFENEEKKTIFDIFKNTHIINVWGANYSILNYKKGEWNPELFYHTVKQVRHHYKGIHPMRINKIAQDYMCDVCINHLPKILQKNRYHIQIKKVPYICNSVFAIKTDTWREIIHDRSLYRDGFDEVPLNIYKDIHDKNICVIRNANCVHPSYNTVVGSVEISYKFFDKIGI